MLKKMLAAGAVMLVWGLQWPLTAKARTDSDAPVVYLADQIPDELDGVKSPNEGQLNGGWRGGKCVLTNQEFKRSISFYANFDGNGEAVFPVIGFDYFDATVGVMGTPPEANYGVVFAVWSDDKRLFVTRGQTREDAPVHIRLALKGVKKLKLKFHKQGEVGWENIWWGNARLEKAQSTVPIVTAPEANALVSETTSLTWQPVDKATGYLLELQCERLSNARDEMSDKRSVDIRLPAATTSYDFDPKALPKGRWRWRVHALNETGFLGYMNTWQEIVSK